MKATPFLISTLCATLATGSLQASPDGGESVAESRANRILNALTAQASPSQINAILATIADVRLECTSIKRQLKGESSNGLDLDDPKLVTFLQEPGAVSCGNHMTSDISLVSVGLNGRIGIDRRNSPDRKGEAFHIFPKPDGSCDMPKDGKMVAFTQAQCEEVRSAARAAIRIFHRGQRRGR